jgi:large subunit ribosomal protein L21
MSDFAIVRIQGKQYLASPGQRVLVDRMEGEEGASIALKDVLMVQKGKTTQVGTPTVKGAQVNAKVIGQRRGPKGLAFRYARKKRVRRIRGFRAALTELEISDVQA